MKKLITIILTFGIVMTLCSCGMTEILVPNQTTQQDTSQSTQQSTTQTSVDESTTQSQTTVQDLILTENDSMFTERDCTNTYDETNATQINLSNQAVTITQEGTYIVSGSLSDANIKIEVADTQKVQLILKNVSITSSSSAAIYVKSADKVFITLAENTVNTLTVTGEYVAVDENNIDSVIFSKSDITFNGTGTLNINANYGHGIVGKDDVVFTSGTYNITSQNHGVSANNSVRIQNATFNIKSGKDGIQVENDEDTSKGFLYIASGTFGIDSVADGMTASSYLQINSGSFEIKTGGGFTEVLNEITLGEGGNVTQPTDLLQYSMKCMKASEITINSGNFNLNSYEDTMHSNGNFTINGGTFYILTGDDAIHADDLLLINDINVEVAQGYEGLEGSSVTINGGYISVNIYDDAINSSSDSGILTITGGEIFLSCQGDGVDSNGDFTMSGGNLVLDVNAIYSGGDGDIDVSGEVTFTGGTIKDTNGNDIDPTQSLNGGGGLFGFGPGPGRR